MGGMGKLWPKIAIHATVTSDQTLPKCQIIRVLSVMGAPKSPICHVNIIWIHCRPHRGLNGSGTNFLILLPPAVRSEACQQAAVCVINRSRHPNNSILDAGSNEGRIG